LSGGGARRLERAVPAQHIGAVFRHLMRAGFMEVDGNEKAGDVGDE
jgi:hypothetical protein